jgi:hypothetical protein
MIRTLILAAGLAITASPALAADDACAKLTSIYDLNAKEMSLLAVDARYEDSAMRATELNTEITAFMVAEQANVELMIAQKCSLPVGVVIAPYYDAALACHLARMQRTAGDIKDPPACDRSKWTIR